MRTDIRSQSKSKEFAEPSSPVISALTKALMTILTGTLISTSFVTLTKLHRNSSTYQAHTTHKTRGAKVEGKSCALKVENVHSVSQRLTHCFGLLTFGVQNRELELGSHLTLIARHQQQVERQVIFALFVQTLGVHPQTPATCHDTGLTSCTVHPGNQSLFIYLFIEGLVNRTGSPQGFLLGQILRMHSIQT